MIRYIVIVDRELVHRGFVRPKFVVPPEFIAVNALQSQRCGSGRDFHEMRLHTVRFPPRTFLTANLPGARQPVQHVGQRLRMHQPMLDRYFKHRDQLRMPFLRPLQRMLDRAVQLLAQTPVVALDFFAHRPVRRRV